MSGITLNCSSTLFNEAMSQSNQELADVYSLAGQLALGAPVPPFMWVLGVQILVLTAG